MSDFLVSGSVRARPKTKHNRPIHGNRAQICLYAAVGVKALNAVIY